MSVSRLRERIPSAKPVGPAKLDGWHFVCNKRGKDGSAKANIERSPGNTVWGVLYELDSSELGSLDRIESGYVRECLRVTLGQNTEVMAHVYVSSELTDDARPCTWYKELIVEGAREHRLPQAYVEFLGQLESKSDEV